MKGAHDPSHCYMFIAKKPSITSSLPFLRHPSYVYYTQIMQAETLASAYRLWRRNWKGRGREYTAGALVWQVRTFSFSITFVSRSRPFEVFISGDTTSPFQGSFDNISMIRLNTDPTMAMTLCACCVFFFPYFVYSRNLIFFS